MAKPSRFDELLRSVTQDVGNHPRDLTRYYSEKLGISRVATNKYVGRLEKEGWIARSGPSTRPVFSPGYKRRISRLYPIQGLEEHIAWERDFRPYVSLAPNVLNIAVHGFTEIVNNAIDHSGGNSVFVSASEDETSLRIAIHDDGIGIFEKISSTLGLPDMRQALFELSKGKLTTDPTKHSGEGVFFTSRMFDYFEIAANGLRFNHADASSNDWLEERPSPFKEGTAVFMEISLASDRTTASVYAQFAGIPEDYEFSKTIVPMKLARNGDEQLISRSQAKRLIARFDRFKTVVLDFAGVQEIGQAFADELFRVYGSEHPSIELIPSNMTVQVERMYLRVVSPQIP